MLLSGPSLRSLCHAGIERFASRGLYTIPGALVIRNRRIENRRRAARDQAITQGFDNLSFNAPQSASPTPEPATLLMAGQRPDVLARRRFGRS
jgi:hypothetical protein